MADPNRLVAQRTYHAIDQNPSQTFNR